MKRASEGRGEWPSLAQSAGRSRFVRHRLTLPPVYHLKKTSLSV